MIGEMVDLGHAPYLYEFLDWSGLHDNTLASKRKAEIWMDQLKRAYPGMEFEKEETCGDHVLEYHVFTQIQAKDQITLDNLIDELKDNLPERWDDIAAEELRSYGKFVLEGAFGILPYALTKEEMIARNKMIDDKLAQ